MLLPFQKEHTGLKGDTSQNLFGCYFLELLDLCWNSHTNCNISLMTCAVSCLPENALECTKALFCKQCHTVYSIKPIMLAIYYKPWQYKQNIKVHVIHKTAKLTLWRNTVSNNDSYPTMNRWCCVHAIQQIAQSVNKSTEICFILFLPKLSGPIHSWFDISCTHTISPLFINWWFL